MILKPIMPNGRIAGTGTLPCPSRMLGGVLVSADGTNAGVVTIRKDSSTGAIIFDQSAIVPTFWQAPILASDVIYYSISGTGCTAMLYEWID